MTKVLKGKDVADALSAKIQTEVSKLKEQQITPALAIVRVGQNASDISYERGALKRAEKVGVQVKQYIYEDTISQDQLIREIGMLNDDGDIHGVLIFRPLPDHIDDQAIAEVLSPAKDVDGITSGSLTGVFTGEASGFAPCTARACMELLDYYNIDLSGKKAVVLGRSLVIGKPVAMMLMAKNATVTICHSKTGIDNMCNICRGADIVVAAMGRAEMVDQQYLAEGQIIIDVGINTDEEGHLCGDVKFNSAEGLVQGITPVPGGVGSVTTAVLMLHVVEAVKAAI